jgi:DNA-binding beta-propeller fold protein YncE
MTDHVEVYGKHGKRLHVWPIVGAGAYITAIAIMEKDIWIANSAGRVVVHGDLQGSVIGRLGEKNDAEGYPGLIVPSPHLDVAIAPGGNLYVTNPGMHRVETHSPDGKMLAFWGESSSALDAFCGCCNPTDIALLPDGRFITSEKGIPRVKIYSATGQFQEVVAGPESFASNTMGLDLAVAPDHNVLVLDPKAKVVRIFQHIGAQAG